MKIIVRCVCLILLLAFLSSCIMRSAEEVSATSTLNLKLLTQNTMLLPSIAKAIDERVPCLMDLISSYEIVGLQEVFDKDSQNKIVSSWYAEKNVKTSNVDFSKDILDQKEIVDKESNNNPNIIDARPNDLKTYIVYDKHFVMGPDYGVFKQDGGLIILSELPIISAGGFIFKNNNWVDYWANKGVIYARIQIGDSPDDYIHVFNTHLQAHNSEGDKEARSEQIKEIYEFVKKAIGEGESRERPIIFLGDFNIISGSKEYKELEKQLLNKKGIPTLEDLWPELKKPSSQPDYTWIGTPDEPKSRKALFSFSQNTNETYWDSMSFYDKVYACAEAEDNYGEGCYWKKEDTKSLLEELKSSGGEKLANNDIELRGTEETIISFAVEAGGFQTIYIKNRDVNIEGLTIRCECTNNCQLIVYKDTFNDTGKDGPFGTLGNIWSQENDGNQRIDYIFINKGTKSENITLDPISMSLVPNSSKDKTPFCFDEIYKACKEANSKCELKSYTVSDHLGVEMEIKASWSGSASLTPTPTMTITTQSVILPSFTSTPTSEPTRTPTIIPTITFTHTPTITLTNSPTMTEATFIELEYNVDRMGMDYKYFSLPEADPNLCMQACLDDPQCLAFTYVKPGVQETNARCWLKNGVPEPTSDDCCISGVKYEEP